MYIWDETWEPFEVLKQLKRNCMIYATMAKMFIFISKAETRVKSSKQLKISTNGLFQSDLCNVGPISGRFRLKSIC